MIKRNRASLFKTLKSPISSCKKDNVGFFIGLNKKKSHRMAKSKNNYLNFIDNDNIIDDVSKKSNDIIFNKKQYAEMMLKKVNLKCKNQKQKEFIHLIDNNEITICIGDSGVGKSYLSIAKALELFKSGIYEKIFIITPIVESEENIGYLKGDLEQKTFPYLYSIYYLVDKIIDEDTRKKLVESGILCPLYMSFLRGINLDNSLIISDESQNMTIKGMKTLLTRIGYNSKFIISGDLNQIDRFKKAEESGLKYVYDNLQGIKGMGFIEFGKEDIVRNPIIGDILDKFNV
jgi:phosphate starvation-inducible PhoH-like protein